MDSDIPKSRQDEVVSKPDTSLLLLLLLQEEAQEFYGILRLGDRVSWP
ncbi:unnamed protein product [Brassica oleracea var. botrytis]